MKAEDYDTVFYVAGTAWDLRKAPIHRLIRSFYNSGKPVALVAIRLVATSQVTYKGAPIVKN